MSKIKIAGVSERDIDLLILEEVISTPEFQYFLLSKVGFKSGSYKYLAASRSVTDSTGESDLEILFEGNCGGKFLFMIENKIGASFQPQQAERYTERGDNYIRKGDVLGFSTVLIAPSEYFSNDSKGFDYRIDYEEILEWYEGSNLSCGRKEYKVSMLNAAIEKGSLGYQMLADSQVGEFWREYWLLSNDIAPEFFMAEPAPKPSGSTFIYFRNAGLPEKVVLVHKLTQGSFDLQFSGNSGKWLGVSAHLGSDELEKLEITVLSAEAYSTSNIEGEVLNRESVQSSIQRQLGLKFDDCRVKLAEQGIAELMVDVYRSFDKKLTHKKLFEWHKMVMRGRNDLKGIGKYRTDPEPMQIVSGPIHAPKIHYEAPPATDIHKEMGCFIEWFNASSGKLPATVRASIAHLYFESIHPFEDGNGRIGRAIAEYAVSQTLGQPVLLSLSEAILKRKNLYYDQLNNASKDLEITAWIEYFSETIIQAQELSFKIVSLVLEKNTAMKLLNGKINARQEKVLLKMFELGVNGFQGGMSSSKYQNITKASPATATRDLLDLVEKAALVRTGNQKNARYWLPSQHEGE